MTLVQLQYLVAVDMHRHFGQAAAHCHVSQPTLSMQIRKLEEELGLRLLDRSRHPVVPTEEGTRVIAQARRMLDERDRLVELVDDLQDKTAGTLRLGLLPTLAPYLIPLIGPSMSARYPAIELVLHEGRTQELLEGLRADTLDALLLATDEEEAEDLHERLLFTEPFVAYVHPSHKLAGDEQIAPSDLEIDNLWLLSEGHCFRDQVLHVCGDVSEQTEMPVKACPSLRYESDNIETLVRMVRHTGGMTLLPYLATRYLSEEEQERHIRPFAAPVPKRHVRLVFRRAHRRRRLLEAFEAVLRSTLPAGVEPGPQ